MKALVVSCLCNDKKVWYSDKIGEVFDVKVSEYNEKLLSVEGSPLNLYKSDCHIVESLATVLLKWESEGGQLQLWNKSSVKWIDIVDKESVIMIKSILRIKPEEKPEYRAYTFEEAALMFTKNAWIEMKHESRLATIANILPNGVWIAKIGTYTFEELLNNCLRYPSGQPCGVKIN